MADNPFKQAIAARKKTIVEPEPIPESIPESIPEPEPTLESAIEPERQTRVESRGRRAEGKRRISRPEPEPQPKKRGRPATGKRSDDEWIGRTFYVRRETDLDVEMQLLQLKRQGIDIDKSELVEILLSAWVKWQQGDNLEIQLFEISPIQKGKT